jgi:hypothetical protein
MQQHFRFDNRSTKLPMLTRLAALLLAGAATVLGQSVASGPYFGQTPPGTTPVIFAPGILSLANRMEARLAFSPDGNECFFTVPQGFDFSEVRMYYTKCVHDKWTPQEKAPFTTAVDFVLASAPVRSSFIMWPPPAN